MVGRERGWREARKRSLKALRAAVGLSQLAVAEAIEITERHYWRIENGYDQPTDRERARLARVLKVAESALPFQTLEAQAS